MNRKIALKLLNLSDKKQLSDQEIDKNYQKMLRRYPPDFFPDKAILLKEAYDLLNLNKDFWKKYFNNSNDNSYINIDHKDHKAHKAHIGYKDYKIQEDNYIKSFINLDFDKKRLLQLIIGINFISKY